MQEKSLKWHGEMLFAFAYLENSAWPRTPRTRYWCMLLFMEEHTKNTFFYQDCEYYVTHRTHPYNIIAMHFMSFL